MWKNVRPGVYVEFTTDDGENLDGEILYSDDNKKFFMFQRPAKSGRQDSYDVYFYRHENVKEIRITRQNASFSYPELDLEKVTTPQGSAHFRLPGEDLLSVRWMKPDIHVLEQTVIKAPYSVDSVQQKNDASKAKSERDYVEKFYSERNSSS
ncbi:hypothetical protein TcWFU_004477 [Taenia crassiceps]|uniref:LSM12 anticodon-binding domain-containing protein n=1 Tax=Taenia crassiceps TaxID=6207 RepID=A0ABR4QL32_9CEST